MPDWRGISKEEHRVFHEYFLTEIKINKGMVVFFFEFIPESAFKDRP